MPGERPRPIKLAILAMGGEGGGVLADWIAAMGEHNGYLVQTTSVPGVAQRTGATIYYLELFPKALAEAAGKEPVLALMPVPGDVDVVLASELMEAGRAVQRGLVTPDRTTLVASTHRVYSMTERLALADGRVDATALLEGCRTAARRLVAFDMAALAEATNSVMSAVLFGSLAGSGALPFGRNAFEDSIRHGGIGVAPSLAAFAAGFEAASGGPVPLNAPEPVNELPPPTLDGRDAEGSADPLQSSRGGTPPTVPDELPDLPEPGRSVIRLGLGRVADYQDRDYARLYLDRLQPFAELERAQGDGSGRLLAETARVLALGMTYEDAIRVAELKIRPSRFDRVRGEVRVKDEQILEIVEFMHPRLQEIADTLPAGLGRWLLDTVWARRLVERFASSGRAVKTTSVRGFLLLYGVASMKPLRPRSLRFAAEQRAIEHWLDTVRRVAAQDYALAVEVAECRNLVKGYGETLDRGRERFETLMGVLPRLQGSPRAAADLERLRRAALSDESGAALSKALTQLEALPHAAE